MTRHRIAQISENRNPKSPENRPQTRRFLQIRLLQLRRSATPFNGLAVLHGRLFGTMAAVHAKENDEDSIVCSARGLTGTYLFHASGFNISVTGVPQPKAIVEVFRFDGDGKLTGGAATVSINGTILHSQSTAPGAGGTYAVNSSCVGSLAFSAGQ